MEGLRDIKEVVEVQEHSLAMLLGLVAVALLLLALGVYLFKNRRRRRKKLTAKELALEKLRNLDYNNAKEVVYTFEAEAEKFLSEKNQEAFNEITKELGIYKYKKEVPTLEPKVAEKIKTFIKGLR